ncbi:hypothetical protein [Geodermatophilus sabuli]|uniref:Uncharacterized protein n=1 Tax=Geodermatophilus sabuli TaxID=1564158 RepID=A0A285E7Q5_9ACTN|nr:hypothetical protein [Geodermatophilus sabuli]MBB3082006.1 hypothetical protein [Geodermatophilus sabuli]SNX95122.1 hypothetical protein SAMN06893097_101925 [Geodermatophilus sabuli]
MTAPRDPWSDPATQTEHGAPYAGPPPTAAVPPWVGPPYGAPAPGWPPYGASPYGMPWPSPPAGPRRPGQVIAAAVLAFVQAAGVAVASAYVFLVASLFALAEGEPGFPGDGDALATEATAIAAVQIASVVALVVGGVMALSRRSPAARWTLVVALGLQVALAVYWAVRLFDLLGRVPGGDPSAVLLFGVFCFAAAPAVGLGLLVGRSARDWFAADRHGEPAPSR